MYRTQYLRDALLQVDNYVEDIIEKVTKIRDLSESYNDDFSKENLKELLDDMYNLSDKCLSVIE